MITQAITDPIPPDAKITIIKGDVVEVYTEADQLYIDAQTQAANAAAAQLRWAAKQARTQAVEQIKVTTAAGNTFDGDEGAQTRMARAVVAMDGLPPETTTLWVLADNTAVQVTRDELKAALLLAGEAQSAIWLID